MILTFWACIVTLYSSDTSSDSLAGLYVRTYNWNLGQSVSLSTGLVVVHLGIRIRTEIFLQWI